jgi:hypothetical protein
MCSEHSLIRYLFVCEDCLSIKPGAAVETMNQGTILTVRGSVVDVYFPQHIPSIYNRLVAGTDNRIVIEVITHLTQDTIRGVSLTPTAGLARGDVVTDTGFRSRCRWVNACWAGSLMSSEKPLMA